MELKNRILKPLIAAIAVTRRTKYEVDDFFLLRADDPLDGELTTSGLYSGEVRCMYDLITKDEDGMRIRLTIKPDSINALETLVFDTYGVNDFDDNRSIYSATFRLHAPEVGIKAGSSYCPNLSLLYLQGCTVLITEDGRLIQGEQDRYILGENSRCDGYVAVESESTWTPWIDPDA